MVKCFLKSGGQHILDIEQIISQVSHEQKSKFSKFQKLKV